MVKNKKVRRKTKKKAKKVSIENKFIDKFKERIKLKYSKFKKSISKSYKSFTTNNSDKLSSLKALLLIVIGYGLLISIPAYTFFDFKFNILTILSFGVMTYFIKDEFVEWIRRILVRK